MAAEKPIQLKVGSLRDAQATPPTMGRRVRSTGMDGVSPRNMADKATEKNGSMALIVWVNETATWPRLTL
eukprot:scaffold580367_cov47-Prasinocladus_malaysianus.AAC.1